MDKRAVATRTSILSIGDMRYQVRALSAGRLISLDVEALHETDAARQVRERGLEPISTRLRNRASVNLAKRFPVLLFSQELLTLLNAGLGLVEAMEGIAEKEQRDDVRMVLQQILESLYRGQAFSAALENANGAFPALYIASVRASEKTSDLAQVLLRYIVYEQQLEALKKKLLTASIYPALLISVGGLVVLFLLVYVVPRFAGIYTDLGNDQPWMLSLVLAWSGFVEDNGQSMLIIASAALVASIYAFTLPKVRAGIGALTWRIPVLGDQMRVFQLARFYRTLGMLLAGGIPMIQAMEMAKGLLAAAFHPRLGQAASLIREGRSISDAMEATGLVTPISLRMLRVGEKGGDMGRMMEHVAALHDEDLARWLEWFTRLFEPLLMIFIGLVIGGVVMMLYMPIFELAGSLQ